MQPVASSSPLALALLVVGEVLVLLYATTVYGRALVIGALGAQFGKLLRARQLARAVKLAQAADYPALIASRRALEALQNGLVLGAVEGGDYRTDAVDRSPDAVIAALRAKFELGFYEGSAQWRQRRVLAAVGTLLLACASAVTAQGAGPWWVHALAAAGALVFGWTLFRQRKEGVDARAMFESLRAELYETATNPGALVTTREPIVEGRGLRFEVREPGLPPRWVLIDKEIIKVGRGAPTDHLRIECAELARMHAVIEVERDGEVSIIDLGGDAGTRVNGVAVNKRALASDDVIEFGPVQVVVRFEPQDVAARRE